MAAKVRVQKRLYYKIGDACKALGIQPYVLRSWENEFPELGVSRTPGGPRVYRKADVERVLQIRHLVLAEGLTLAGVRRKLDEDRALLREVMTPEIKVRLSRVRDGLRAVLDLLSREPVPVGEFELEALARPAPAMPEPPRRPQRRTKA